MHAIFQRERSHHGSANRELKYETKKWLKDKNQDYMEQAKKIEQSQQSIKKDEGEFDDKS